MGRPGYGKIEGRLPVSMVNEIMCYILQFKICKGDNSGYRIALLLYISTIFSLLPSNCIYICFELHSK